MEGKKKTASGTEKEAALAELDRVERELAELGPDPALEADKKSNAVLDNPLSTEYRCNIAQN